MYQSLHPGNFGPSSKMLLHSRVLVFIPAPHVWEQLLQEPQGNQFQ